MQVYPCFLLVFLITKRLCLFTILVFTFIPSRFSRFFVKCDTEWVSLESSAGGEPVVLCGKTLPEPLRFPGGNITVVHHFFPHQYPVSKFILSYSRGMKGCSSLSPARFGSLKNIFVKFFSFKIMFLFKPRVRKLPKDVFPVSWGSVHPTFPAL